MGDLFVIVLGALELLLVLHARAASPTTTTLQLSSSSVSSGTVVTLTAAVSDGSPVTSGTVVICDATAADCANSGIVGVAKLTSAGTAVINLTPASGNHSYRAMFQESKTNYGSSSATQMLKVTERYQPATSLFHSDSMASNPLTGTHVSHGFGSLSLWGNTALVDASSGHLTPGPAGFGTAISKPAVADETIKESESSVDVRMPPGPVATSQDFSKTVLPLTELKFVGTGFTAKFGTGFCLDPECRFIGTNYHIALRSRPKKIRGEQVVQRYLATGPDDEGATWADGQYVSPMKYNLSRDLAVFELRHPVPHYHGIPFSLRDLQVGQEIDIYTFPKETINPKRKLLHFHGRFKGQTTLGLLAFDYALSGGKEIRAGASGGIVVESKTQQIVGVLNGIERNGERIALAVPVQSLADFVSRVQPFLAQSIFPTTKTISPVAGDFYPKFIPTHTDGLQHRPEEPAEVKMLRSKAQLLADSLRNFMAVQNLAWGSRDDVPLAVSAYEIQVLGGYQRFREYPDGVKELRDLPFPPLNTVMRPGGEWSELPELVGTEVRLKIHQADDAVFEGRRIKVFQYWADTEDGVCKWKTILDLGFFGVSKIATVACYGEVWTDEDFNILRMSEHYELAGRWKDYQGVVTYGWLQRKDDLPQLVPLTIATQAEYNKKVYWCRGTFTDYQKFTSRIKIGQINSAADLNGAP